MKRAARSDRKGQWPSEAKRGSVTLAYDERHRRRLRLVTDADEAFLLDLERATVLEDGDGLALDDGTWIEVKAAPESLVEITAADPRLLARLAWHLGNRHLPAQFLADRILIREDHVIVDMLTGLGAVLRFIAAPFTPERGAYDSGTPGHHHRHDQDDDEHGHHHD
jgi:urease accessory protein